MTDYRLRIEPKTMWESLRFHNLDEAISRYIEATESVPQEWIDEYNEFAKRIIK